MGDRQRMGSRYFVLLIFLYLFLPIISASPVYQKSTDVTLSVPCTVQGAVCSGAATCTGTVLNPNDVVLYNEETMVQNGAVFELDLNSTDTAQIGEYRLSISCTDGGNSQSKNLLFYITSNGEAFTSSQPLALMPMAILVLILFAIGYTFSKEKWKMKSFFYLAAVLATVVMINSTLIMFSTSTSLQLMGQTALILGIVVFSVYILYVLIYYTIEVFNQVKNAKEARREKSDPY